MKNCYSCALIHIWLTYHLEVRTLIDIYFELLNVECFSSFVLTVHFCSLAFLNPSLKICVNMETIFGFEIRILNIFCVCCNLWHTTAAFTKCKQDEYHFKDNHICFTMNESPDKYWNIIAYLILRSFFGLTMV